MCARGVKVHAVLTHTDDPEVASVSLELGRKPIHENGLHAFQPRACNVTKAPGSGAGGRRLGRAGQEHSLAHSDDHTHPLFSDGWNCPFTVANSRFPADAPATFFATRARRSAGSRAATLGAARRQSSALVKGAQGTATVTTPTAAHVWHVDGC